MSDEIRRYWEQQERLRQAMSPLGELRSQFDRLTEAYRQLGTNPAMLGVIRQEEERHRAMSALANVGRVATVALDFERQSKLLEGPFEEARRLGLFDPLSDMRDSIKATLEAQRAYENLFRLPEIHELSRIAHEVMTHGGLAQAVFGAEDQLQAAMASMRSPWLQIEESSTSANAFAALVAMGHGMESRGAFDLDFAAALRLGLGDWRDPLTPAPEPLVNPVLRSEFYQERGFDPNLTDFTPQAFNQSLLIAGLREADEDESTDEEEDGFARANEAYALLRRFEVELRRFIAQAMGVAFGGDWMRRQLPPGMYDKWIEKRDTAVKSGRPEEPIFDYADFTDYKAIIERRDNWSTVFKPVFGRPEDVRESFQRMFPVRIATMHARLLTLDDELLLLVETKRVLRAIRTRR